MKFFFHLFVNNFFHISLQTIAYDHHLEKQRMSTAEEKRVSMVIVLSHQGLKETIADTVNSDGPWAACLKSFFIVQGESPPSQVEDWFPVRLMQLLRVTNHVQLGRANQIDMDAVEFEKQPSDRRRCCNLRCGQELSKETAQFVLLGSRCDTPQGRLVTSLIAYVCKNNDCAEKYQKALCDFLTIDAAKSHASNYTCSGCKKLSLDVEYKVCSRCKETRYCSTTCQKADWNEHRPVCQEK